MRTRIVEDAVWSAKPAGQRSQNEMRTRRGGPATLADVTRGRVRIPTFIG
jgi:hypothetical protein